MHNPFVCISTKKQPHLTILWKKNHRCTNIMKIQMGPFNYSCLRKEYICVM